MRTLVLAGLVACGRGPAEVPDTTRTPVPWTPPATPEPPPPPDVGATRLIADRDFLQAARDALDAAQSSVRVAQFVMYDGPSVGVLLDGLEDAADRGVDVRILADQEGDDTEAILERLAADGVHTRQDSRLSTLHSKIVLADGVALVGSHNWTEAALSSNHEGTVLIADGTVAAEYAAWFDGLWDEPELDPPLPSPLDGAVTPLADTQVVGALVDCLDQATVDAHLVLYALAWDPAYPGSEVDQALTALIGAHARGVSVRVTLDASPWTVSNGINDAAIERLEGAGITVERTPGTVTTHAKVLRCDDTVIVSDANWSYSGLALMNGTSARLRLPDVAEQVRVWADDL